MKLQITNYHPRTVEEIDIDPKTDIISFGDEADGSYIHISRPGRPGQVIELRAGFNVKLSSLHLSRLW